MQMNNDTGADFVCSNCGALLKTSIGSQLSSDVLEISCPYCKAKNYNPNFSEDAFKPYRKTTLLKLIILPLTYALLPAIIMSLIIFKTAILNTVNILIYIAFFTIFFLLGLLTRDKKDRKRLDRWVKSDERLKNREYAARLHEAGYEVPEHYL